VFAGGLSVQDCENIHQLVRERWSAMHLELVAQMTRAVDHAPSGATGRIRVGIYTYYEDQAAAADAPAVAPQREEERESTR
jgi:hypothetical protein